jgi:hypothetical protein
MDSEGHAMLIPPVPTDWADDQEPFEYVYTLPSLSPAMQKDAEGHESEFSPWLAVPSNAIADDHEPLEYVYTLLALSPATQNVAETHDSDQNPRLGALITAWPDDHEPFEYVYTLVLSSATQKDSEGHAINICLVPTNWPDDHEPFEYVYTLPSLSPAMQKVAVGHDTVVR